MGGSPRFAALAAVAALLAIGVPACGSDDDSTTSPPVSTQTVPGDGGGKSVGGGGDGKGDSKQPSGRSAQSGEGSAPTPSESAQAAARRDSGGGSTQYRVPGGDNSIQDYGAEADDSEREEAAVVLHAFLAAQANQDWGSVCSYLSRGMRDRLEQLASASPQLKGKGCEATVAALLAAAPSAVREELTEADVGSLRVEGDSAFILYHGARGANYSISMARESGGWKIGALTPNAFPEVP